MIGVSCIRCGHSFNFSSYADTIDCPICGQANHNPNFVVDTTLDEIVVELAPSRTFYLVSTITLIFSLFGLFFVIPSESRTSWIIYVGILLLQVSPLISDLENSKWTKQISILQALYHRKHVVNYGGDGFNTLNIILSIIYAFFMIGDIVTQLSVSTSSDLAIFFLCIASLVSLLFVRLTSELRKVIISKIAPFFYS